MKQSFDYATHNGQDCMELIDGQYTVRLFRDELAENPRMDFDHLGTMVCWHGRYNLGDVDGLKEYGHADDFLVEHENDIILPLYLYDHSGLTMNTSGFSCPWDSGQVGFIYIEREDMLKEFGKKRMSKQLREKAEEILRSEVQEYDSYLTGDVFYITVERKDPEWGETEDLDCCGGFLGQEYAEEAAIEMLEACKDIPASTWAD